MFNNAQPKTSYDPRLTDHPLSAKGRFGRLSYVAWLLLSNSVMVLWLMLMMWVMGVGSVVIANIQSRPDLAANALLDATGFIILLLYIVPALYLIFVFAIRRLHDINQSGWLSLLMFVPLINALFLIYLSVMPGTPTINRFGPPRPTKGWEKVLSWLYILLTLLTFISYAFWFPMMWISPSTTITP